jgi:transcriptional regulator with XRE-family HTH domain
MEAKKVGVYLKKLRVLRQYTQKDVAKICSVSNQAVSKWENGDSIPDIEILEKLSALYGVSINQIIMGGQDGVNQTDLLYKIIGFSMVLLQVLMFFIPFRDIENVYGQYTEITGFFIVRTSYLSDSFNLKFAFLLYLIMVAWYILQFVKVLVLERKNMLYVAFINVVALFFMFHVFSSSMYVDHLSFFYGLFGLVHIVVILLDIFHHPVESEKRQEKDEIRVVFVRIMMAIYGVFAIANTYATINASYDVDLYDIIMLVVLDLYIVVFALMSKKALLKRTLTTLLLVFPLLWFLSMVLYTAITHKPYWDPALTLILSVVIIPIIIYNLDLIIGVFRKTRK